MAEMIPTAAVHNKLKRGIATTIKCPRCGFAARDGERLRVRGFAEKNSLAGTAGGAWFEVTGFVVWSYEGHGEPGKGFGVYRFEGIDWDEPDAGSSDGEKVQCTKCGKWSPLTRWGFYNLDR